MTKPTFDEIFEECVQHYVDRGYSVEYSRELIGHNTENWIRYIYECIQKEKASQTINSNNKKIYCQMSDLNWE